METHSEFVFEYVGEKYTAHLTHCEDCDGCPHIEIDHIEDVYGSHVEPEDGDNGGFGILLYTFFLENYHDV